MECNTGDVTWRLPGENSQCCCLISPRRRFPKPIFPDSFVFDLSSALFLKPTVGEPD